MKLYAEFRKDGWPLCPRCGEDELQNPHLDMGQEPRPTLADYLAAGLSCLSCGWEGPAALRQLDAEVAEGAMTCERCRRDGLQPGEASPEARLLRRARAGYCADCAITAFLRETSPLDEMMALRGPEVLLDPMVQRQVAQILASGQADARPEEIDWARVVANWPLPIASEQRKRRRKRDG